jgi:uncharacterized protein (TIRG00374 family)
MRKSLRQSLLLVLAMAVVGILLYRSRGAIGLEGFDWSRLWASVAQARPLPLLLSIVAIYAAYAVRALRWARFSCYQGRLGFSSLFSATLIGFSAVFLLGRAGEPIRPLLIARKERLPVSSAFGIYVLERVFDVAATVVIAGLALLAFSPASLAGESQALLMTARTTGIALLVGLLAVVAFLLYFRLHGAEAIERRLGDWHHRPGWHARAAGLFQGFSEGLRAIRTFGDLLMALWYTAIHWAVIAAIYYWVQQSFPGRLGELSFTAALLVLAFTMVGSTVQLPGVGGGSQLASFLAFTVVFGVEKEPAAAASVVLWLVTFAACIVAGVPLLIREGWSMGELRRLAREEKEAEALGTHVSLEKAPSGSGEVQP